MPEPLPLDLTRPLWGRDLRHALLALLQAERVLTIEQLRARLEGAGATIGGGNPNKVLSDALGWEASKGHVRRTRRGEYAYATVATTTARRVRLRWELARRPAVAVSTSAATGRRESGVFRPFGPPLPRMRTP